MSTNNNHHSYDEAKEKKYSKRDIDFLSLLEFNSHPILVYCREAKT
jgi:hypothetical protein